MEDIISRKQKKNRSIFATVFGTTLESYDFTLFVHMLTILKFVFFDNDPKIAAYALTATKVGRLLGGIAYGHIADKKGRRSVLIFSIITMIIPTILMGFLPTYAQWGVLAGILFTVLRTVQAFAMGGESSVAGTFVTEHAGKNRPAFYTSLLRLAGDLGSVLAISVSLLCLNYITNDDWNWRVPFFVSIIFSLSTLYMRRTLIETDTFTKISDRQSTSESPIRAAIQDWKPILAVIMLGVLLLSPVALCYTVIPGVLSSLYKVQPQAIMKQSLFISILASIGTPLFALITDKWGVSKSIRLTSVLYLVSAYPLMNYAFNTDSAWGLFMVQSAIFAMSLPLWTTSMLFSAKVFHPKNRVSGTGLSWGIVQICTQGLVPVIFTSYQSNIGIFCTAATVLMFSVGIVGIILSLVSDYFLRAYDKDEAYEMSEGEK